MLIRYCTRKDPSMGWSKNTYLWLTNKPAWMPDNEYYSMEANYQSENRKLGVYASSEHEADLYYHVELVGLGSLKAAISYNAKAMATCYVGDKKHKKLRKKQQKLWQILDNWYEEKINLELDDFYKHEYTSED
jgi:hypothetical protein